MFSILAMGLLFQNCSGGGSGTGGGSGAGPNSNEDSGPPPPEISVNAFPGQTAAELTITDESPPNGLEVSGKCDSKEHGQEVTVKAVGHDEDNPVVKTTECNAPEWSVTLEREDLNNLQGRNMKALFRASIESKTGVTGTSEPQALFVEPKVEAYAIVNSTAGTETELVLEEVYQIGDVCRGTILLNLSTRVSTFSVVYGNIDTNWGLIELNNASSPPNIMSNLVFQPSIPYTFEPSEIVSTNAPYNFITKISFEIPKTDSDSYRFRIGGIDNPLFLSNAYSYCKGVPAE